MSFVTKETKIPKAELYKNVTNIRTNYFEYRIALNDFYKI